MKGRTAPVSRQLALLSLFGLACAWTAVKSMLPIFHIDELYFWLTTYEHGPVRRGLVGTIAAPLIGASGGGGLYVLAITCSLLGLLVLICLTAAALRAGLAGSANPAWYVLAALLAASPFLGLALFHIGYPDAIIASLVLACALNLARASPVVIAVFLVFGSMIHELAFLLLFPIVVFEVVHKVGWRNRDYAIVAVSVAAALVFPTLAPARDSDLLARLVSAGLSPSVAQAQIAASLHQSTASAFAHMWLLWRAHPLNGILGAAYAGLPGIFILWIGTPAVLAWHRLHGRAGFQLWIPIGLYLGAGLSAFGLLFLAWDLARIGAFTTLTAFATVCLAMRRAPRETTTRSLVTGGVCACCFLLFPVCNLYFDYGRCLRLRMVSDICPACGAAGLTFIDYFNRGLGDERRREIDNDALYGGL